MTESVTCVPIGSIAAASAGPPLVSVIIPAYNASRHLAECLGKVREQVGHFTLQTLVIDDGSKDSTGEIARAQPGVECLTQPNRGPSAARNTGIAAARGEFIAFLDADDLWPQGKLSAQLGLLMQNPDVALVAGDCRQFDARGPWPQTEFATSRLGWTASGPGAVVPDGYARLLENNFITTGSVVVRRAALANVGGFDEGLRLVEDLELWLRIARRYPIGWCTQECLLRRRHAENISRDVEAMGLALLEVLRRQGTARPGEAGIDVAELTAREQLHLAEIAIAKGGTAVALRRTWYALTTRPNPSMLWRASRLALKAVVRRAAAPR